MGLRSLKTAIWRPGGKWKAPLPLSLHWPSSSQDILSRRVPLLHVILYTGNPQYYRTTTVRKIASWWGRKAVKLSPFRKSFFLPMADKRNVQQNILMFQFHTKKCPLTEFTWARVSCLWTGFPDFLIYSTFENWISPHLEYRTVWHVYALSGDYTSTVV